MCLHPSTGRALKLFVKETGRTRKEQRWTSLFFSLKGGLIHPGVFRHVPVPRESLVVRTLNDFGVN